MVRYIITDPFLPAGGGATWEVFPLNDTKLALQLRQDTKYKFFQWVLSESVILQKSDSGVWAWLLHLEAIDPCQMLTLIIQKECDGQWIEDWQGKFTIYDCEFDKDQCTIAINTKPFDDYVDILEDIDTDYNILDITAPFITDFYDAAFGTGNLLETYERGKTLSSVGDFFVSKYGLSFGGNFFVKGDPIAGRNLKFLSFHAKADCKHPIPVTPATELLLSFGRFAQILNRMFDVYWHIVNGQVQFEHEQFFLNGLSYAGAPSIGLDLSYIKKVNKYKYLSTDIFRREEWSYGEGRGTTWINGSVEYTGGCVDKVLKREIEDVTVDI